MARVPGWSPTRAEASNIIVRPVHPSGPIDRTLLKVRNILKEKKNPRSNHEQKILTSNLVSLLLHINTSCFPLAFSADENILYRIKLPLLKAYLCVT